MDWLDLLAVQGTLKSLLQHHSSKVSILQRSAFFIVQLSHPYMTIGKTIALTRWTFDGKVTSLLFNMLSRLVIAFLPRNKHLLISWPQSPSAVTFRFSRGSSQPRDQTQVSCIAGRFFSAVPQGKPKNTGVGSLSLLQQIFLTWESNRGLLHCRQVLFNWAIREALYIGLLQYQWLLKVKYGISFINI